ncbi:MAG: tail fiber domain-containing protein [Bacteroidia bacterium]
MKKIILLAAICALCTQAHSQWSLTGNAGTNTTTNFIGTTDKKALKIRTNNAVRMTINSSGKVGIGITAPVFKLDVKGGSINTDSVYRIGGNTVLSVKGLFNTFIGISSGVSNTSGSSNTAAGVAALANNTIGLANTANGMYALFSNTSGNDNTATGRRALYNNTTGISNTAIGVEALYSNTTGNYNTANGYFALYNTTTGFNNTAIGVEALYSNSSGNENTANGYKALYSNTDGYYNTAVGNFALYLNTGSGNTAYGRSALASNTTGTNNTGTGLQALYFNTTGVNNAAYGMLSLYYNTTGNFNTAIGYQALIHNTTGHYNTGIGYGAGPFSGFSPSNFTALGNTAGAVGSSSNEMEIGNTSVSWIGGQSGFFNYSDKRIKDNIQSNVPGLSFITKLNPVTYNLNIHRQNELCGISDTAQWEGKYDIEKITQTGFLAQEVEQAAKENNYDFNGVRAPHGNGKLYSIQYASFVVPLVKAVQELNTENENLKSELEMIKSVLSDEQQQKLKSLLDGKSASKASEGLEQNYPNPFNTQTEIKFRLPGKYSTAQLIFTDANGKQIRTYDVQKSLSVIINASELSAGTYSYALIIDGVTIDSKQMILTR